MTIAQSKMLAALTAIALVALAAVGLRLSDPDEKKSEVINGVIGKPVKVNDGEVTVTQVKVGTALKRYGEIQDSTPGMFVAVSVTGAATGPKRCDAGMVLGPGVPEPLGLPLGGCHVGSTTPGSRPAAFSAVCTGSV